MAFFHLQSVIHYIASIILTYFMKKTLLALYIFAFSITNAQDVAILKYNGGGDWYSNPTAIPNLIAFANETIKTNISKNPLTVAANNEDIFNFPIVFMTGHGNVFFSEEDAENLRNYLISGGFLHISDNYGLDKFIRKEIKKVFPTLEFKEIPSNHAIYNQTFKFPNGLPKIHEHDGKRPQAFGIFCENRLVLLFTFEADLGDGWEDPEVHNDPKEIREKALQFGANIISYVFKN